MRLTVVVLLLLSLVCLATATDRYASPSGSGTSPCTNIASPCTFSSTTVNNLSNGDTLYLRAGTYAPTAFLDITTSGASGNLKRIVNYPDEVPVLDGINMTNTTAACLIFRNGTQYWQVKGLEITRCHVHGILLEGSASNFTLEQNHIHHAVRTAANGAGIQIETGSNNLLLNNDSHHQSYQLGGTGGDGFGIGSQGTGNILRGNRAWRNQDDGFDLWDAANVLVEDNWAWENGYDDSLEKTSGNGQGFKLGGAGAGDGNHTVRFNLSWENAEDGFSDNAADTPFTMYNNTAWSNNEAGVTNFTVFTAGVAHVLRNNLSVNPGGVSLQAAVDDTFNSWNLGVTVDSSDFVTMDFTANLGVRQADGSLPESNFLRLVAGSDLIDAGTDMGEPFTGSAPDVGAFEFTPATAAPFVLRLEVR